MIELYKQFGWSPKCDMLSIKVTINTSNDVVTVWNSYKIKKIGQQLDVIDYIKEHPSMTVVAKRNRWSLLAEWRAHNLLHWLGYERSRTTHCDFDDEPWYRKLGYYALSLLYFGQ